MVHPEKRRRQLAKVCVGEAWSVGPGAEHRRAQDDAFRQRRVHAGSVKSADRALARADEGPLRNAAALRYFIQNRGDIGAVARRGAELLMEARPLVGRRIQHRRERLIVEPVPPRAHEKVAALVVLRLGVRLVELEDAWMARKDRDAVLEGLGAIQSGDQGGDGVALEPGADDLVDLPLCRGCSERNRNGQYGAAHGLSFLPWPLS